MKTLDLKMEYPEERERITPALALALLGYEGTPDNQAGDPGAPESHSAVPEVRAGTNPQPNP